MLPLVDYRYGYHKYFTLSIEFVSFAICFHQSHKLYCDFLLKDDKTEKEATKINKFSLAYLGVELKLLFDGSLAFRCLLEQAHGPRRLALGVESFLQPDSSSIKVDQRLAVDGLDNKSP